jgi:hypothetical protein
LAAQSEFELHGTLLLGVFGGPLVALGLSFVQPAATSMLEHSAAKTKLRDIPGPP